MVSYVTNTSLQRGKCTILRNPPNQTAIIRKKKKKEGGLKCGKHEGRSGGIAGFQTSLNTSYLSSRLPRARVGGG